MSWLRVRHSPSTLMPVLSTSRCSRPFELRYMRSTLTVFGGLTERIQTVRAGSPRTSWGYSKRRNIFERGRPETPQRNRPTYGRDPPTERLATASKLSVNRAASAPDCSFANWWSLCSWSKVCSSCTASTLDSRDEYFWICEIRSSPCVGAISIWA